MELGRNYRYSSKIPHNLAEREDYHPPRHISFASRYPPHEVFTDLEVTDGHGKTYKQTLWPDHCIQGSSGVEIESSLRKSLDSWKDRLMIARKVRLRPYGADIRHVMKM
jgi:hypothetical protein